MRITATNCNNSSHLLFTFKMLVARLLTLLPLFVPKRSNLQYHLAKLIQLMYNCEAYSSSHAQCTNTQCELFC